MLLLYFTEVACLNSILLQTEEKGQARRKKQKNFYFKKPARMKKNLKIYTLKRTYNSLLTYLKYFFMNKPQIFGENLAHDKAS